MVSSKRRDDIVVLQANDIDGLKQELSRHLGRLASRQHPEVIAIQNKVPYGLCSSVDAGQEVDGNFVFPLGGTLQDFVSLIPNSIKDIWIAIEVQTPVGLQKVEQRMQDGFRSYNLNIAIPDKTFGTLKIINKGKTTEKVSIGFTYQQGKDYEIKKVEFNGLA